MKKYSSKIGIGIVLFLVIILGGTSTIMIINQIWSGLAIIVAVILFTIYLFASIHYVIDGNELIVKSGFIKSMRIKIESIKKIKETNNPLSSPATSLDRIAIYYNKSDFVFISPKAKLSFIKQLTEINPNIEVIFKKKTPVTNTVS